MQISDVGRLVSSALKPVVAPTMGDAPAAAPADSVSTSGQAQAAPAGSSAPSGTSLPLLAATSLAGPPAAVLSDPDLVAAMTALQSRGVELHKERGFRIPVLMSKTETVSPQQVLDTMNANEAGQLSVKTPASDLLPLRDRQDVMELSAFFAGGDVRQLADPGLGSLVRDLHMDGYELKSGAGRKSDVIGPYGAYNALAGPWDGPSTAFTWRNGVALTALPQDAGARPVEVREEIRKSKLALEELEKRAAGDPEIKRDLDVLRAAVGEASFATRADVLARLKEKGRHYGDSRVDYGMVAKSVKPGESLQDVADFFLGIVEKNPYADTRDMHGAFNYCRQRLGHDPVLMASFLEIYGATKNVNTTIRALDVIWNPVGTELYTDRRAAFLEFVKAEQKLNTYEFSPEQALDDFQYVSKDIRPGESFQELTADWLGVIQGLEQARKGIGESKAIFRHIRDNLSNDPTRKAWFRDAFASTGRLEDAKSATELVDRLGGSPKPEERAEVLLGLLRNTHDVQSASRYYEDIANGLKPGEDFKSAGTIMFGLMDDLHEVDYNGHSQIQPGLDKAYAYARNDLAGDPQAVDLFRQVVKGRKSYQHATSEYPSLRPAVRGESEADRVKSYLRLNELARRGENPVDWYRAVTGHLLANETLQDGVGQMEALAKAIRKDRGETDFSKAFVELKSRHANNPDEVRLFTRLCDGLESYGEARKARKDLEKPMRGEALADREATFFRLLELEKDGDRHETVANYHTLRDGLVDGESVEDGTTRFIALRSAVRKEDAAASARDCFAFIHESLEKGAITGRTANEVTAEMVESLLLNGDVNAAKNRAVAPRNAAGGNIEKKEDYVVIGGIKVPVQR